MVRFSMISLAFAATCALALPQPQSGDGAENVGLGDGSQFITGGCLSDADCASGCCAGSEGSETAACSAEGAQFEAGKTGCGFGGAGDAAGGAAAGNATADAGADAGAAGGAADDAAADDGAAGGGAAEIDENADGADAAGAGDGSQFITGQCLSDADCASGCCAGSEGSETAACSAEAAQFEAGKTGCGFEA